MNCKNPIKTLNVVKVIVFSILHVFYLTVTFVASPRCTRSRTKSVSAHCVQALDSFRPFTKKSWILNHLTQNVIKIF